MTSGRPAASSRANGSVAAPLSELAEERGQVMPVALRRSAQRVKPDGTMRGRPVAF